MTLFLWRTDEHMGMAACGKGGITGASAAVWLFNPFDPLCLLLCPDMWIQASPHVVPMSGFRHDASLSQEHAPSGVLRLTQCSTRSSLVVTLSVLPTSHLSFPTCHRMVSLSSRAVRTERRGLEALTWAQLPGAVFSADLALGPQESPGMAARPCICPSPGTGGDAGLEGGPGPLLSTEWVMVAEARLVMKLQPGWHLQASLHFVLRSPGRCQEWLRDWTRLLHVC